MALKRKDVPVPMLPAEVVDLESVGGEVIVRGVPAARLWTLNKDNEGSATAAGVLLAESVLKDENTPLWPPAAWDAFSCKNRADWSTLLSVANRLSGLSTEDTEKN